MVRLLPSKLVSYVRELGRVQIPPGGFFVFLLMTSLSLLFGSLGVDLGIFRGSLLLVGKFERIDTTACLKGFLSG